MTYYDLINMSDAVTFQAPDLQIAALATLLIGNGQYMANAYDDAEEKMNGMDNGVPPFLFVPLSTWWQERWPESPIQAVFDTRKSEVADCFDTFLYGKLDEYKAFMLSVADATPQEAAERRAAWNDSKRSSLNNICNRAYANAKALREKKALETAPQQVLGE